MFGLSSSKSSSAVVTANTTAGGGATYGDLLGGGALNLNFTNQSKKSPTQFGSISNASNFSPVSIAFGDTAVKAAQETYSDTLASAGGIRGSLVSGNTLWIAAIIVLGALFLKGWFR